MNSFYSLSKRQQDDQNFPAHFPSEEICTTNRQWEQINKTKDLSDNEVEVVQEEGLAQFVFTYRCSSTKGQSKNLTNSHNDRFLIMLIMSNFYILVYLFF